MEIPSSSSSSSSSPSSARSVLTEFKDSERWWWGPFAWGFQNKVLSYLESCMVVVLQQVVRCKGKWIERAF